MLLLDLITVAKLYESSESEDFKPETDVVSEVRESIDSSHSGNEQ